MKIVISFLSLLCGGIVFFRRFDKLEFKGEGWGCWKELFFVKKVKGRGNI